MEFLQWLETSGPTLGVSAFFVGAWYMTWRAYRQLMDAYLRDMRRCVGFEHPEQPNGDE